MKFYGQFEPPVDQIMFQRYRAILLEHPGYFLECGAFDGVTESNCKFLEESLHWRGINVEPFPRHYCKLMANRPQAINMNCALSSQNGTLPFTHVVHPRFGDDFGNGSLAHTVAHHQLLVDEGCRFVTIQVPALTYDAAVEVSGIPRVDVLSLDVEGHEVEVLQGMIRKRFRPRLICIETGHVPCQTIDDKLQRMGYVKDSEYLVNSFYLRAARGGEECGVSQASRGRQPPD